MDYNFNPLMIAIKPLLEKAMHEDGLFADEVREKESRTDNPKSLAECAEYILGEAYHYASSHRDGNFGLAGCSDEQIVGMIKHYYDEDNIEIRKVGKNAKAQVKATKGAEEADEPGEESAQEEKPDNTVKVKFTRDKNGNQVATGKDEAGNEVTTLKRNGQTFQITEFSMFGDE